MKNGILFASIILIIYVIGLNNIMTTLGYEKSKSNVQKDNSIFQSIVVFTDYKIIEDNILLKSRICKRDKHFISSVNTFTDATTITYAIKDNKDFILSELHIGLEKFKLVKNNCLSYNGTLKLPIKNLELIKVVHSIKAIEITRYGKLIDMVDNTSRHLLKQNELVIDGEIFILDHEIVNSNNTKVTNSLLEDFDNFLYKKKLEDSTNMR